MFEKSLVVVICDFSFEFSASSSSIFLIKSSLESTIKGPGDSFEIEAPS